VADFFLAVFLLADFSVGFFLAVLRCIAGFRAADFLACLRTIVFFFLAAFLTTFFLAPPFFPFAIQFSHSETRGDSMNQE
jgi:hypothetical protein